MSQIVFNDHELRWLDYLIADNGLVELRHQNHQNEWKSRFHRDVGSIISDVHSDPQCNWYTSLNRPRAMTGESALTNRSISEISRFCVDIDPIRPAGTRSSDYQRARAKDAAMDVTAFLISLGFPPPAIGDSGNGTHLCWRVGNPFEQSMVGTKESSRFSKVRKLALSALDERFSNEATKIDVSVFNAGRIWRLYGTTNQKGASTTNGGRVTSIMLPPSWPPINPRLIRSLATLCAHEFSPSTPEFSASTKRGMGRGDYRTLDIRNWFMHHGLYKFPIAGNRHAVRCPWSHEHTVGTGATSTDTIIYEADGGWPGFFCHHDHCAHRRIREVMQLLGDADAFCTRSFSVRDTEFLEKHSTSSQTRRH